MGFGLGEIFGDLGAAAAYVGDRLHAVDFGEFAIEGGDIHPKLQYDFFVFRTVRTMLTGFGSR